MKKRVCIILGEKLTGALFVYITGLAHKLKLCGIDVEVIGVDLQAKSNDRFLFEEIECLHICGEDYAPHDRDSFSKNMQAASVQLFDELNVYNPSDIIYFANDICLNKQIQKFVKYRKVNCHYAALEYPSIEWRCLSNFKNAYSQFLTYRKLKYSMRMAVRNKSAICISHAFESLFAGSGCRCYYLPHPLTIHKNQDRLPQHNVINIMYCGYPGVRCCKDRLDIVINALANLGKEQRGNIFLHIYGPFMEEVSKCCCIPVETLQKLNIVFHGNMSLKELEDEYKKMDFSVLIRDDKKKTRYGYPTKVAVSLANGVPVICNLTSDLGDIIINGTNGIIVEDNSVESLVQSFKVLGNLKEEEIYNMREGANKSAIQNYEYTLRLAELIEYLE